MRILVLLVVASLLSVTPAAFASFSFYKKPTIKEVSYDNLTAVERKQVDCLTNNIYFEAGSEPVSGQLAVAFVTLNRTKLDGYPSTVCEVVKQKTNGVCQFSWWCDVKLRAKALRRTFSNREHDVLADIRGIATKVYFNHDMLYDVTKGSTHFHAAYVSPQWKYYLKKTVRIGNHIFYRT